MKKLLTLTLALLVAAAGYSQVRSMSKNDARKAVATEKVAIGNEVMQNVGSQPGMTRTDFYSEQALDYSYYDWHTNTAAKNVTMTFPDGCLGFAYTISTDDTHSDRGTDIIIYNPATDEWTTTGGKIEEEKTGFGCAARYGQNGIVVVSRNATTLRCGVYIIEDKDNLPAAGTVKPIIEWDTEHNIHFPTAMCTGPNHDHIHILFTALNEVTDDGQTNPFYYFRSMDGGQTWDEYRTIEWLGRDYAPQYGSGQDAYFIENNGGNELNIVVNTRRGDGAILTSYDEGDTWERKVYYQHPGIDVDFGDPSTDGTWFFYPRWTSAVKNNQGIVQLAYEFNAGSGDATSTSYYPGIGGVAFWSEDMPYRSTEYAQFGYDPNNANAPVNGQPFVMDSAYIYQDIYASWPLFSDGTHVDEGMLPEYFGYLCALTDDGDWESWEDATAFLIDDRTLHGGYNCGCVAMPVLVTTPMKDLLVCVWIMMDENNMDDLGNYFFKLFAACSHDQGMTWSNPIHLTNNFLFRYSECVYPQAAITDNKLVITAQMDGSTDNSLLGDDPDPSDNYYQGIVYDLNDLFGYDDVEENVASNTSISVYPNPASESMSISLSNSETVVISNMMGQVVMTFQATSGISKVDISNLSSGLYFISAGSATQKFVVK